MSLVEMMTSPEIKMSGLDRVHPGYLKPSASIETMTTTVETTQLFSLKNLRTLLTCPTIQDDQKRKLKSIDKHRVKGRLDGEVNVTYELSRSKVAQTLKVGGIYGSTLDLGTCQSDIRGTLCKEYYHDIDITNCQPTLLLQIADRDHKHPMPYLEYYINNRDDVLAAIGPSRSEAKEAILRVIFGSRPSKESHPRLTTLYNEIFAFTKLLIGSGDYKQLWEGVQSLKDRSMYGSFLAFILQTEQRKVMLCMKKCFEELDWSVDILMQDGFMVRRRKDAEITAELLESVTNSVWSKLDYKIKLIEKPIIAIDIPDTISESEAEYQLMKSEFELTHFHYRITDTVVESTNTGLNHWNRQAATSVFNTMLLSTCNEDGVRDLFIKRWLSDPERRLIRDLVFKLPEDCKADEASLFVGFRFEHLIEAGVTPNIDGVAIFEDLLAAACNDDLPVITYVRNTFAHIIQKPFEANGVCIIFSSIQEGTGKDTLLLMIQRLIGHHVAHYTDDADFWEKHDTKKEGALMMYLEEAGAAMNKAKANALKARITTDSFSVNPKGTKGYTVPNMARYFMTTNEPDPVKFGTTNRRFLLINPSDRLMKTDWESIHKTIADPGVSVALGEHLMNIDLSDFNPRKFPMTEVTSDMMELSYSNEVAFLRYWVTTPELPNECSADELFQVYRSWASDNGIDHTVTKLVLTQKIATHKGKYFMYHLGTNNKSLYKRAISLP